MQRLLIIFPLSSCLLTESTPFHQGTPNNFSCNNSCYSCNVSNNMDSPTLFTLAMQDGLGSVVTQLVNAQAFAAKIGWRFGGAVGKSGKTLKYHRADEQDAVRMLFGAGSDMRPLAFPENSTSITFKGPEKPWVASAIPTSKVSFEMSHWISTLPTSPTNTFSINEQQINFQPRWIDYFLDAHFLVKLRKTSICGLNEQLNRYYLKHNTTSSDINSPSVEKSQRRVLIVAHFRRGDSDSIQREFLTTHPSWYFQIFDALGSIYSRADMHAFSSCRGKDQCSRMRSIDVPKWNARGINLHVDDERLPARQEVTEDWKNAFAHMATAHIFIMAKSSLSNAAALFNGNCVIRSPRDIKHTPISRWILVSEPDAHDRAYAKVGVEVDEKVYDSHFNASQMTVVKQDSKLPFALQLKHSLSFCLPQTTKSFGTDAQGEENG
jgi:hypothetical protein